MRSVLTAFFLLFCCAGYTLADSSAKPANAFYITNLNMQKVKGANTTLQFTVYDPDPLTNATKVCRGSWKAGSAGYPNGPYIICSKSTFAWTMATFKSIRHFGLDIEHSYKDPAVGDPPYNIITNFAAANISAPAIECSRTGGQLTCQQAPGTNITAPIYASVAR